MGCLQSVPIGIDADLRALDLDGLRQRWRNLSGKTAGPGLTRSLLLRLIEYEQQAARSGRLPADTQRMLLRIAAEKPADAEESAASRVARATGADRRRTPGTILVREWQGVLHRVTVLNDGFAWNGTTYTSLSRIAREITGTSWNGHVFFGGRDKSLANRRTYTEPTHNKQTHDKQVSVLPKMPQGDGIAR